VAIAEAKARITVDDSDLSRVDVAARQFEGKLKDVFKRTGDVRPAAALEGFITNLSSGNVTGAIESVATKLTGLGLLGGAAFAVLSAGAVAAHHQLKEFDAGIEETSRVLARMPQAGAGLEQITKHIGELTESVAKTKGLGVGGTILSLLSDVGGGSATDRRLNELGAQHAAQITQITKSLEMEAAASRKIPESEALSVELQKQLAVIHDQQIERISRVLSLTVEAGEKQRLISAVNLNAIEREANARKAMQDEQAKQLADRFKPLVERSQLSFEELLKLPVSVSAATVGKGETLGNAQYLAQQAQKEMSLVESERLKGHTASAFQHFYEAERIKSGIGILQEKEKMPEHAFKQAIDGATVFQHIAATLDDIDKGINSLSFTNK
jgi:hypothetical protein